MRTVALLLLCLATGAAGADAAALQSHDELRAAALDFLERQTADSVIPPKLSVSRPDPRLRLARCDAPLEAQLPPGGRVAGNFAVGVRCPGSQPWTIYLTASVREFREVLVLTRPLPRGSAVAASDLRLEVRDTTSLRRGYLVDADAAVGMLARRPLAAGSVLGETSLELPKLVQRGQQVVLVARAGGLEVRSAGKALSDGREGELVRVQNVRSSRVVEAVVMAPGTVVVQF